MSLSTRRHGFRAMGTNAALIADARISPERFARAAGTVELLFAREELRFSRFRYDSELTHLNARAGRWTTVSPAFAALLGYALRAAATSDGLFDPTVLPTLIAAGYDRDFDEVIAGARGALHPPVPCGRWSEVQLDADQVLIPADVALDLGGVAKGWTVDAAARAATTVGELPWAAVNAGGDLRLVGVAPPEGIDVAVEDPDRSEDEVARVSLVAGALATSSVTARAWGPGLHHLIDPRTGRPSDTGVLQATVWAETCAEAEILSKCALLEGPSVLERLGAVLVMEDGRVLMNIGTRELEEVGA